MHNKKNMLANLIIELFISERIMRLAFYEFMRLVNYAFKVFFVYDVFC